MLYMNSINIVHGSKKKMETCTFTQNIRENKILLSIGGGATCCHNAQSILVSLVFIVKFVCDVTMVTRGKLTLRNQLKYK